MPLQPDLFLSEVVHEIIVRLVQADAVERSARRDLVHENTPDHGHDVFNGRNLSGEERYVEIEILVIELIHDFRPDDTAEALEVTDESGLGIRPAFDGHEEREIMSVPVPVGAFSKDFLILRLRPVRAAELMGSIEVFFPCNIADGHSPAKLGKKHGARDKLSGKMEGREAYLRIFSVIC